MTNRAWIGILAAGVIVAPAPALAAAALAVGVTGNPSDGIAIGYAYNYKSEDEAVSVALGECKNYKRAPDAARRCRLIGSTRDGCFATAFDPKSDSPGMGWAVAATREAARSRALGDCRAAAPSSRRQFCEANLVKCDGDRPPPKDRDN